MCVRVRSHQTVMLLIMAEDTTDNGTFARVTVLVPWSISFDILGQLSA